MAASAWQLAGACLFGFVCGSVPFGWVAGRLRGLDIRHHGSGNIGFTNVQRTVGWSWAVPVFILDFAKGALPAFFSGYLGLSPSIAGFGAVCGHIFTPWLGFRGGKGVATTMGVAVMLCPRALIAGLPVYAATVLATGFISLASVCFALILPALLALFYPGRVDLLLWGAGVAALILVRHRTNLIRLLNRREPRLGIWVRLFRNRL